MQARWAPKVELACTSPHPRDALACSGNTAKGRPSPTWALRRSQVFPKRLSKAPVQKRWRRQLIDFSKLSGAPREIRTPDLLLRRWLFSRWPTQNEQVRRAVVGNRWLHWAGLVRFCSTVCATARNYQTSSLDALVAAPYRDTSGIKYIFSRVRCCL